LEFFEDCFHYGDEVVGRNGRTVVVPEYHAVWREG